MQYIYVTQQVRPIRICFLIGHNKKNLVEALSINSILWGGIYNPIIELQQSGTAIERKRILGVMKDFDPDFIINLSAKISPQFKNALKRDIVEKNHFLTIGEDGKKELLIGISTLKPILSVIPEMGLSKKQKDKLTLIYPRNVNLLPYIATVYGYIDKDLFPNAHSFFTESLGVLSKKYGIDEISSNSYTDLVGIIQTTDIELKELGGMGSSANNLIYIGDFTKRKDLIEFWNLRAAGKSIIYIPVNEYTKFAKPLKEFISLNSKYMRFDRIDIEIQKSPTVTSAKFKEVANWIKTTMDIDLYAREGQTIWGRRHKSVVEDISCVIPFHSREKITTNYTDDDISPFNVAAPKFIDDTIEINKKLWAIDLSFIGFYEKNYTIDLPNQRGMENLAKHSLIFAGHDSARLGERGLIVYADNKDDTIHLNPILVTKVIEKLFSSVGFKILPSTPGIFANKILQIIGEIDSARVFKIKGVREALTRLNTNEGPVTIDGKRYKGVIAKPHPLQANEIMNTIGLTQEDEFGSKNWIPELYEDITLFYGQAHPLTPEIVLDYLIRKKLIVPGLNLRCNECLQEEWYKIGGFSDKFKCNYCFTEQDVPRVDKQNWCYRTEGIVSIADEGKGSLPVILSIWRLNQHDHFSNGRFITSINVESEDSSFKGEVDYIYYSVSDFSREMKLVLGEARNYTEYKAKDINKLLKIAKNFSDKPYLAFTTLKDKYTEREKRLLKRLLVAGYFILPFTRWELDPYDLYDRFEGLKNKYATDLEEFSLNLCELNLGINAGEVYDLLYAKEKKRIEEVLSKIKSKESKQSQSASKKILKNKNGDNNKKNGN